VSEALRGGTAVLVNGPATADRPFGTIVDTYHTEIHRYLRRVVSRGTEADHLSQETFLRAFRGYRSLPADQDVRAWLFAIATRLCRTHVQSARRRGVMKGASGERAAADGAPPGEGRRHEARSRLEDVIGCLPVTQCLAVTMRKLHDLDYDVIGASLDCSAETARAHVIHALRQIRRGLDGFALPEATRTSPRDAHDRF
jgi:RNA polymerase sigma factor (sigma-70 family)